MAQETKLDYNLLIIAGIGIGAFFMGKKLLELIGLGDDKDSNLSAKLLEETEKKLRKTMQPSKTELEWQNIAQAIYQDLKYSSLDDNKSDAVYQICRVQNDLDVLLLLKYFGKRQEYAFGIPTGSPQTLQEFIISNIDEKGKNSIAWNYANKGIKIKLV